MSNLIIKVKEISKGKKYHYEVYSDGVKIGERKSPREYVAAAVFMPDATRYKPSVASWIGRIDLIGKNMDVKRGAQVAHLETTSIDGNENT